MHPAVVVQRRACGTRRESLSTFFDTFSEWVSPHLKPGRIVSERVKREKEKFVVRLRLRENESINDAVKRFRKLVEHTGIKKEMRRRQYYEKPSDQRRRSRRRAERRARINRLSGL